MLAIELVRLFTCGTTWLCIATVIHVDTPCKLINTEIKLHCNPGCESCNVDKQLQATTTNQTTVYVQLTTASTWRTIQLQKVYTTTRKSEKKNYCTILCYINTHIQKYIYSYFRNSTLTLCRLIGWNHFIYFINISARDATHSADYAVAVCPSVLLSVAVTCRYYLKMAKHIIKLLFTIS